MSLPKGGEGPLHLFRFRAKSLIEMWTFGSAEITSSGLEAVSPLHLFRPTVAALPL